MDAVGLIIGKGGQTLKRLMEEVSNNTCSIRVQPYQVGRERRGKSEEKREGASERGRKGKRGEGREEKRLGERKLIFLVTR